MIKDEVKKGSQIRQMQGSTIANDSSDLLRKQSNFFQQKKINSSKRKENMSQLLKISGPAAKTERLNTDDYQY